jgi:hypothetical protein
MQHDGAADADWKSPFLGVTVMLVAQPSCDVREATPAGQTRHLDLASGLSPLPLRIVGVTESSGLVRFAAMAEAW